MKLESIMADKRTTIFSSSEFSQFSSEPKTTTDFAQHIQEMLQQMQDKFQMTSNSIFSRIDETGRSLEELEKTVSEMMTEAGVDRS